MKTNKILYQWDAGQKLTDCRGVFVDFVISGEVYRCDVVNGECIVPDELLQHPGNQTAYECMADNTLQEFVFSVVPRPLPPDYVYTPTEKLTFEGLVQKVEDTVADIIRRADTGEFDGYTPVKGKDYFTESEKNEMMQRVSDGAIGEFREVVDSATAGFNKNSSAKTNDYNANAEKKVGVYDSNAAEKLKAYNDNHTEKMTAYDANAAGKTAEFDSHAAELQTEVNNLKAECTTLRAEAGTQEHRIDALMKLNKGQTYDILPEEGESASRTAPSGAKYVSVDKVGGKSVVWNQLCNPDEFDVMDCTVSESGGIVTIADCTERNRYKAGFIAVTKGHKYYQTVKIKSDGLNPVGFQNYPFLDIITKTTSAEFVRLAVVAACNESGNALVQLFSPNQTSYQIVKNSFMLIDLTVLFGAGNEPTAEQFERMFPEESYPYNPSEIISSTTANVELEGKNLWNDSDPAFTKVLTKAGFTFDGSVWKSELIDYIATPIKIEKGTTFSYDVKAPAGTSARFKFAMDSGNLIYRPPESDGSWKHHSVYLPNDVHKIYIDYTKRGSCEIKNIQLERSTTETAYSPHTKQSLSTGFPELKSAGTAHDEIDMDGGAIRRNVGAVDLGTLTWDNNGTFEDGNVQFIARVPGRAYTTNGLCDKFEKSEDNALGTYTLRTTGDQIVFTEPKGTEIHAFVESMSGATLYYELATPTTEPVTIPEALQEWLPVEAGGTVTFRNADESKQLAVPNAVSWVRKLDEVN